MSDYTMRHLEPRDMMRVIELGDIQNERDGTEYPVPIIYDLTGKLVENIPLALVTEYKGEVVQAQVFQRTVEMLLYGGDKAATDFSKNEMGRASWLLKARGFTGVHCFAPQTLARHMARPLRQAGFNRFDPVLAHFYRSLSDGQP